MALSLAQIAAAHAMMNSLIEQRLITHYQRLLNYIKPDVVHILVDGKIVRTGRPELAEELEKNGYTITSPAPPRLWRGGRRPGR